METRLALLAARHPGVISVRKACSVPSSILMFRSLYSHHAQQHRRSCFGVMVLVIARKSVRLGLEEHDKTSSNLVHLVIVPPGAISMDLP